MKKWCTWRDVGRRPGEAVGLEQCADSESRGQAGLSVDGNGKGIILALSLWTCVSSVTWRAQGGSQITAELQAVLVAGEGCGGDWFAWISFPSLSWAHVSPLDWPGICGEDCWVWATFLSPWAGETLRNEWEVGVQESCCCPSGQDVTITIALWAFLACDPSVSLVLLQVLKKWSFWPHPFPSRLVVLS
jgi:hypothetical protein